MKTILNRSGSGALRGRSSLLGLAIVVAAVGLLHAGPSQAAEPTDRIVAQASPSASPTATPTPTPEYQFSAYVDGSYVDSGHSTLSFLTPNSGIPARVFDYRPNLATLDTVNVQASKTSAGVIGWKVELNFGNDANVMSSYNSSPSTPSTGQVATAGPPCGVGTGTGGTQLGAAINFPPFNNPYRCLGNGLYYHTGGYDVTQAYFQYTSVNGKFNAYAGKFSTLAGEEVIESPNDFNFSRSILFGYAVPFTHTGVRFSYAFTPQLTATVGANNGWDDLVGVAGGVLGTFESQLNYTNGGLTALVNFYQGSEQAAYGNASGFGFVTTAAGVLVTPNIPCTLGTALCASYPVVGPVGTRTLIDAVASDKVTPQLTVAANYDMGSQSNTCCFVTSTPGVIWDGIAGYANYAFGAGKYAGTVRWETFSDPQGYRTGTGIPNFRWSEATLTAQDNFSPNWFLRAEYRFDYANAPAFAQNNVYAGGVTGISKSQGTFEGEMVLKY